MLTVGRQRLIEYMKRHGYNQKALCELLDMAPADISRILAGTRRPGLTKAARIEARTGIPAVSWTETARGKSRISKRASEKTPAVA